MTLLPFRVHPLLRNSHAQTVMAIYLGGPARMSATRQHQVELPDGDRVVLHDNCPAEWKPGERASLLIHGLAGSHSSMYMLRIAEKLNRRNVRTFRMDLRGCGAGTKLARLPYHSGRSDDAAAALEYIAGCCPGSPLSLIGFSLGGNIVLKLLGEPRGPLPKQLESAVAVCPPIDLAKCVQRIARWSNRLYERHLLDLLWRQMHARKQVMGAAALDRLTVRPRSIREFDEAFTAPLCGFASADDYYQRCSSAQFMSGIRTATLVIAAADDPLIPIEPFGAARPSASTTVFVASHGGHLGFISRGGSDPDRRWMDWRVVEWVSAGLSRSGSTDQALQPEVTTWQLAAES